MRKFYIHFIYLQGCKEYFKKIFEVKKQTLNKLFETGNTHILQPKIYLNKYSNILKGI